MTSSFQPDERPAERITVENQDRLDIVLAHQLGLTRTFTQKMIRDGYVSVPDFKKLKPSTRVSPGDLLDVRMPPVESLEIEPEDVPFVVVYEDEYILVVDKPAGVVVHPAPGHWRGTLVHGLLWRYPNLGPFNNVLRPGIVHRLDSTTSGLMLVAREQKTMELLQQQFKARTITKEYLALVHGTFEQASGRVEGPIDRHPNNRLKMAVVEGGRPSATEYRVLWNRSNISFVLCRLITGRTHQIRVHMSAFGHPLIGDTLYGAKEVLNFNRVFLHSWHIAFTHPVTGTLLSFKRPLPLELTRLLQ